MADSLQRDIVITKQATMSIYLLYVPDHNSTKLGEDIHHQKEYNQQNVKF